MGVRIPPAVLSSLHKHTKYVYQVDRFDSYTGCQKMINQLCFQYLDKCQQIEDASSTLYKMKCEITVLQNEIRNALLKKVTEHGKVMLLTESMFGKVTFWEAYNWPVKISSDEAFFDSKEIIYLHDPGPPSKYPLLKENKMHLIDVYQYKKRTFLMCTARGIPNWLFEFDETDKLDVSDENNYVPYIITVEVKKEDLEIYGLSQ